MDTSSDLCASCHEALVLEIEPDSDVEVEDEGTSAGATHSVPDDVALSCGCHYHWECLLESYTITQCPNCNQNITTTSPKSQQQQVLVTVRNEGGVQANFDILPLAQEEAYLRTYPEERRGYAFLGFCKEGDIDAIQNMVLEEDDDDENEDGSQHVLMYTGNFGSMEGSGSGLHVAIANGREEVLWLLLYLGSSLKTEEYPSEVLQAVREMGIESRQSTRDLKGRKDIRELTNGEDETPADLARRIGGTWERYVGVLTI